MNVDISEKIYSLVNVFHAEEKQARDYGSEHLLYHSEVNLIVAVFHHPDSNTSELADILSITNGAITQVANKLIAKGLLERYKQPANQKDTYYRLTQEGETVYHGHENHHKEMNAEVFDYMDSLDESQSSAIITLLDLMIEKLRE